MEQINTSDVIEVFLPADESDTEDYASRLLPKPTVEKSLMTSFVSALMIPLYVLGGLIFLILFLCITLSSIGPLVEFYYAQRDKKLMERSNVLKRHDDMFLLEIPGGVNQASAGNAYKVMVRLTKPKSPPAAHLPPVIFPGGLAANLVAMARHQDTLTNKYGFTVVNFDRLGVGFSDPNPSGISPSARDVANEMNFVMLNSGVAPDEKWIQIGGSMGTNVATAFACLFPGRLSGFFNLDGLPHAFLQLSAEKFLKSGPQVKVVASILWTGIFRFLFSVVMRNTIVKGGRSDTFTEKELIACMIQPMQWRNTALEYATLMSCCDLETASLGKQATTALTPQGLFTLASLAPNETVKVNEINNEMRQTTSDRSHNELGDSFILPESSEFQEFWTRFQALANENPSDIDLLKTNCNWPNPPQHPVVRADNLVGGVEPSDVVYPLAAEFSKMVVRVMTARDYAGLESEYSQEARNHSMAKSNLQRLLAKDGESYIYPFLSHTNLWQQSDEIARITHDMAVIIEGRSLAASNV